MDAWWLLLIVPAAVIVGAVGAVLWFANEIMKGWR